MTDGDASPRVPPVTSRTQLPEGQRRHYDSIAESRGSVRGPFAVLMHSPEVAGRVGEVGEYLRFEGGLPPADRELAVLVTARAFDCAYEWAAHEPLARDAGVSDVAVDAVATRAPTDDLAGPEALVVRYGRELFGERTVAESTFRAARDRLGVDGVTELTATMGYYALLACVCNAFGVVAESGPSMPP